MDPVIEVEGLRKVCRRVRGRATVAVDGLDVAVPAGGVFGFLGPNGAGKTTTIRLPGLVRASGGRRRLLGQEPAGLHRVIGRVGSIVESPAMYPRWLAEPARVALRVGAVDDPRRIRVRARLRGRNSAVALGVGFGYLVVVENLVRGVRPQWTPWLLTDNSAMAIIGRPLDFPLLGRSTVEAGLYLAAVGALLLLAAVGLFRFRDVNQPILNRRRGSRPLGSGWPGGRRLPTVDRMAYVEEARSPSSSEHP